ncbi:MAG: PqqD family protein [Acidimicrobiia bacterium]|nr:PqqD family protein [Acidimicrobiia bacterium]
MSEGASLGGQVIGPPLPQVIETDVKGEVSLYDPKTERVLVLNGPATDVWLLCDGDQTLDRIVELLAIAYRREQSLLRTEVETTVRQFIEAGFVPDPSSRPAEE